MTAAAGSIYVAVAVASKKGLGWGQGSGVASLMFMFNDGNAVVADLLACFLFLYL